MSCSDIPKYDLELYQGDDKTFTFRYKLDGVAALLTDHVIKLECTEASLAKTAIIADQTTNPGEYKFVFVPADTQTLEAFRPKYEVVFWPTGLAGLKTTKYTGALKITQEVVA